ncbi:hypothetical protein OSTOST_12200 [Ostertagia ostertagi]
MERLVDAETLKISKAENDATLPNSLMMSDHIDFNLCDMYSKKRERSRDQNIPIQLCKGMRIPSKMPRDWLEVKIESYMPASQRKDYLCSYINYCNKLTIKNEPKPKESSSNDKTVQYHLDAIKAIYVHQCGYKGLGVSSLISDEISSMVNQRLQKISSEVISSNKLSIDTLRELCELQDWEENYWTIIWDNLASSFRDAPPVSQMKLEDFITEAFNEAALVFQRPAYSERFWEVVEKVDRR